MKFRDSSFESPDRLIRVWFNKGFSSIHGVLRHLREDWGPGLYLIGSHTEPDSGPLVACDQANTEPTGVSQASYLEWCLNFCRENAVDVFLPGRMRDVIADHRSEFEAIGTRLVVAGDGETLRLLEDKGRFLEQVPEGVAVHRFHRVRNWEEFETAATQIEKEGFQVCFKPAVGTFGVGFYIIDEALTPLKRLLRNEVHRISKTELKSVLGHAETFPEMLVMDYLDGSEFSVDVLAHEGEVVEMICRRKPRNGWVRISGVSSPMRVHEGLSQVLAREPGIEDMVRILARHFHMGGLFNVQFRSHAELPEKPHLLEINGRMSGGLPYVRLSGVNLALLAIKIALREPGDPMLAIPKPTLPLRVQERSEVFVVPTRP